MSSADDGVVGPPVRRVAIVDDYDVMRALLRITLDADGRFSVVNEFADAESAIAGLDGDHGNGLDIIVLDASLPGADGITSIPALQAAAPGASIVIFSASGDFTLRDRAMLAGAAAVVPKTRGVDALVSCLASLDGVDGVDGSRSA